MLKISGKPEKEKSETQETKILRRLTNMGFDEDEKQIILARALEHSEQGYMLRCSKDFFCNMLNSKN